MLTRTYLFNPHHEIKNNHTRNKNPKAKEAITQSRLPFGRKIDGGNGWDGKVLTSNFTLKKYTMLNITKNLVLQSIESNKWKHDDRDREITTCWVLFFSFHGVEGFSAFVTDVGITKPYGKSEPYGSFAMIESDEGDLHESFSDQIEENWTAIVDAIKKWESENFKEQTELVTRIENNRVEAGLV